MEVHEGEARHGQGVARTAGATAAQAGLAPLGVAVDHDLRVEGDARGGEPGHHDGQRGQDEAGAAGNGHRRDDTGGRPGAEVRMDLPPLH